MEAIEGCRMTPTTQTTKPEASRLFSWLCRVAVLPEDAAASATMIAGMSKEGKRA
jgi:hypothetical protein